MVVNEDVDVPMEIPVERNSALETKKFVIVQNHVREISSNKNECNIETTTDTSFQIADSESQRLQKNTLETINKIPSSTSSTESEDNEHNKSTEISNSDLEELRIVYNKCKAVIKKIETKYGHLLNVNAESNYDSLKRVTDNSLEEKCHCSMNTKIIFKENGEQEIIDTDKKEHICPKKIKRIHHDTPPLSRNIEIQYSENDIQLPDNLETLSTMLKNPLLEITYRNKIIDKVKSIKQEFLNEIRFNKHSLVDKLKANPDEILAFKGANLASLPGYS